MIVTLIGTGMAALLVVWLVAGPELAGIVYAVMVMASIVLRVLHLVFVGMCIHGRAHRGTPLMD